MKEEEDVSACKERSSAAIMETEECYQSINNQFHTQMMANDITKLGNLANNYQTKATKSKP